MEPPVDRINATFVDDLTADEVSVGLNDWFAWIIAGSEGDPPSAFEPFGVETAAYAWTREDVDWKIGPHARAFGSEVRIALETHDTWRTLSGLLRRLGALSVRVERCG